jgi:hypothetical protein
MRLRSRRVRSERPYAYVYTSECTSASMRIRYAHIHDAPRKYVTPSQNPSIPTRPPSHRARVCAGFAVTELENMEQPSREHAFRAIDVTNGTLNLCLPM